MIDALMDVRDTDDLETMRRRLADAIGWPEAVPEAALLRAIDDPTFASALLTSRDTPGFLRPLLEDPENRKWARTPRGEVDENDKGVEETSNAKLVGRAAEALLRWGKAGFTVAEEDVIARREEACLACPRLAAPTKLVQKIAPAAAVSDRPGRRTGRKICEACGCQVSKKIRLPTEACPEPHPTRTGLTRWGEPMNGRPDPRA